MTIDEIKHQMQAVLAGRAVNIDSLFLYVKPFNHLHELIQEGEVIKGYCVGLIKRTSVQTLAGEWLVVCTNQRILFVLKGLLSGLNHFSLPFTNITSFMHKTGWFFGEAVISETTSSVTISQIRKKDFSFFVEAFSKELSERKK